MCCKTHPTPPGRGGLEPRPRGPTEHPEHAAGMPQSASACLHPRAAAQRCPHPALPRDALPGHLWDEGEGGNGVGNAAPAWLPQILPPATAVAPPEQGREGGAGVVFHAGKAGGGGCPGQAGTGGLCRGGTGWQKDPENLQANTGCRSITVIVAAQGCTV